MTAHQSKCRSRKRQKGVSCIEFAMVLPVLLLILFAIMEYGWLMVHQIVLINAVSTGARAAIRANPEELAPIHGERLHREGVLDRNADPGSGAGGDAGR